MQWLSVTRTQARGQSLYKMFVGVDPYYGLLRNPYSLCIHSRAESPLGMGM